MCKTPELFSAAADTAFVVGCLALFGSRIPSTLRLFLLSLAIFDDVGAILVMAADYGDALNWSALAIGLFGLAVVAASARLGIRSICLSPGLRIARPTAGLNCPFLAAGAFLRDRLHHIVVHCEPRLLSDAAQRRQARDSRRFGRFRCCRAHRARLANRQQANFSQDSRWHPVRAQSLTRPAHASLVAMSICDQRARPVEQPLGTRFSRQIALQGGLKVRRLHDDGPR